MAPARPLGDSPLLLAVESSSREPSVAVLRGDEVLAERRGLPGRTGAESLLPGVDEVLARAGVALQAIEAFAVSIGPGSFTGLRVGVATLKGLAFGTARPVAPVPTLAALARGAALAETDAPESVVAMLDARRGEVYASGWRVSADGLQAVPVAPAEGVYTPEELARALSGPALLVGEGARLWGEEVVRAASVALRLGSDADPHARDVGLLALGVLAAGGGVEAGPLVPRYVRRAEAEVKRTGKRFEG